MNLFHKIAWNVCEQLQHKNLPLYKIFFEIFSQKKYSIQEKYLFLDNFLNQNVFLTNTMRKELFEIFQQTQKKYLILQRFIFIVKYKCSKTVVNTDLCLNPITEKDKHIIGIYQNHRKYLFDIRELIQLVNKALIHSEYFFSAPLISKNPYNNVTLNKSTLYNIYFFMRFKTYFFSDVFHNFFLFNFHLFHFKEKNEYLLRNHTIYDFFKNETSQHISIYITEMINDYNKICPSTKITIDNDFPFEKIISIMKPYVKLYLLSKYSLSYNDKSYFKKEYIRKLVRFYKFNPHFGRKIIKINYEDKIMFKKQIKNNEIAFIDNHVSFNEDKTDDFLNSHKIKDDKFIFFEDIDEEEIDDTYDD